jgi:chemotaxis protein CheD
MKPDQPRVTSGLEHIKFYWDTSRESWIAKILPGEYFYTCNNEMITTVLGSCVSACVRDPESGIGGMNHFMLPERSCNAEDWNESARYGINAMELLINGIMKLGGNRERLEIKLFGGGQIIRNMTDIGGRNITFARRFVATEGLKLMSSDTGDIWPRKVLYHPASGKAWVKHLQSLHNDTIVVREREFQTSIQQPTEQDSGDIELF